MISLAGIFSYIWAFSTSNTAAVNSDERFVFIL